VARKKRSWRTSREDRAMVPRLMSILASGQRTAFEYEGACRAGLRAGLCLGGECWQWADVRAAVIIGEALRLLGATRPTWAEGQRDWVEPSAAEGERWNCQRCAKPIPEERFSLGRVPKFCSDLCKKRAYDEGARAAGAQLSRIEYEAAMVALAERKREQRGFTCESCGGKFLLKEAGAHGSRSERFCSAACRQEALTPRACAVCGTWFKPKRHPEAQFCSGPCVSAARRQRMNGHALNGHAMNGHGHGNGSHPELSTEGLARATVPLRVTRPDPIPEASLPARALTHGQGQGGRGPHLTDGRAFKCE
jgi:hypothetical protein